MNKKIMNLLRKSFVVQWSILSVCIDWLRTRGGPAVQRSGEEKLEWREMFCSKPVVPDISESDSAVRVTFSTSKLISVSVSAGTFTVSFREGKRPDTIWEFNWVFYAHMHCSSVKFLVNYQMVKIYRSARNNWYAPCISHCQLVISK